MQTPHVTGGVIGIALAALLTGLLTHYNLSGMSATDATLIGGGGAALGVAVAHAFWNIGAGPIFSRILHGPPKPEPAPVPAPVVPPAPPMAG